jgi:diaminopimelate epimerase
MPHFVKSHGLGNDYIVMEPDRLPFKLTEENIKLICHRNLGVGSDGILAMVPARSGKGDFGVKIYNPDGSEAEKSGNGTRIFAKYLYDYGHTTSTLFTIDTLGGPVVADVDVSDGRVTGATMNVGPATVLEPTEIEIDGERIPVICISVGNPHCVVLTDDLSKVDFYVRPQDRESPGLPQPHQRAVRPGDRPRRGQDPDLGTRRRRDDGLRHQLIRRGRRLPSRRLGGR